MEQRIITITIHTTTPAEPTPMLPAARPARQRETARRGRWVRRGLFTAVAAALLISALLLQGLGATATAREETAEPTPTVTEQMTGKLETLCAATVPEQEEPRPEDAEQMTPTKRVGRYSPITDTERELIARTVYLEARGESQEGQQAVAEVILNRVAADNFPDSVEGVLGQKGQFSTWAYLDTAEPTSAQYEAVNAAMTGEPVLPMDVVFFSTSGENSDRWGTIGGHVFCYQYGRYDHDQRERAL